MNLILDFDGVICLNNETEIIDGINYPVFRLKLINELRMIIQDLDIQSIIIGSNWREDKSISYLQDCFRDYPEISTKITSKLTDVVGNRVNDIKTYCKQNLDSYIVVDDAVHYKDLKRFMEEYYKIYNKNLWLITPTTKTGLESTLTIQKYEQESKSY